MNKIQICLLVLATAMATPLNVAAQGVETLDAGSARGAAADRCPGTPPAQPPVGALPAPVQAFKDFAASGGELPVF
jgi:hypothetical protein